MARRVIDPAVKAAVLEAVRNGAKKTDVAKEHGLSLPTVYNWLKEAAAPAEAPQA